MQNIKTYKLIGLRKNGMKVHKEYDNKNVALFEFEVTTPVSTKLELFENNVLIDSYEYREPEKVIYLLNGQSPFNTINKRINNRKDVAIIEFNSEKSRCDWLTLYEEKNGTRTLIECFVKGA